MTRLYAIAIVVCMLASSAIAQVAKPATPAAERPIVINIRLIEVSLNRTDDLESVAKDAEKLISLIGQENSLRFASLRLEARVGEPVSARIGQFIPIQTATLPISTMSTDPPNDDSTAHASAPQIPYMGISLNVTATPGMDAEGQIEVKFALEMSGTDMSAGAVTFIQKSIVDNDIGVRPGETALRLGVVQREPLRSTVLSQGNPAQTETSGKGFIVLLTVKPIE